MTLTNSTAAKAQIASLLTTARRDPLAAAKNCRQCRKRIQVGYHRQLYGILAAAYGIALELEKNRSAWKKFRADSYWEDKKKPAPREEIEVVLRCVLYYVFEGKGYGRAYKYARGLESYLEKGVPAKEVAGKLKSDGGIEFLLRQATEKKPRRAKSGSAASGVSRRQKVTAGGDDDRDDDKGRRDRESERAKPSRRRASSPEKAPVLEVEITPARLARILAAKGRKARITVENLGLRGNWTRIRATRVVLLKAEAKAKPASRT